MPAASTESVITTYTKGDVNVNFHTSVNKFTKEYLLERCEEIGITKCKSKNKSELLILIFEKLNIENTTITYGELFDIFNNIKDHLPAAPAEEVKETKPKRKPAAKKTKETVIPQAVEETFAESASTDEAPANVTTRPKRKPAAKKTVEAAPAAPPAEEPAAEEPAAKPKRKPAAKKTVEKVPPAPEEQLVVEEAPHEEERQLISTITEEVKPKRKTVVKKAKPVLAEPENNEKTEENVVEPTTPPKSTTVRKRTPKAPKPVNQREVDLTINMTNDDFAELVKSQSPTVLDGLIKNKLYYIDNEDVEGEERTVMFGRFICEEDRDDTIVAIFKNVHQVLGEHVEHEQMEFDVNANYKVYEA